MKMIKLRILSISVALLFGCAAPQHYQQQAAVNPNSNKDFAECRLEAIKATASAPGGSISYAMSTTIANDIATGIRQGEIMAACLEARRLRLSD